MTRRHVVHHIISRGLPGQDGRSMALVSESEPTGEEVGEVWYNPTGEGELRVWTGSSWDELKGEVPQSVLDDIEDIKDQLVVLASSSFGADNTGSRNTSTELQAMLDMMSATGMPGVIEPGTYLLDAALEPGDNTVLSMHGATLKTNYSAADGPAILIHDKDHVTIEGGTIDGQREDHTGEHRHGVSLRGARWVTIRDLRSINNRGDGVYIGPIGLLSTPSDFATNTEHVLLENVVCDNNARQGMSVTGGRYGTYIGCSFINTQGTDPEAGVDFERNTGEEYSDHHHFYSCDISGNAGGGCMISGSSINRGRLRDITFTDCTFHRNGMVAIQFNQGQDYTFTNCDVRDTVPHASDNYGGMGYFFYANARNIRIIGGSVVDSASFGITSQGGVGGVSHLTVDGVKVSGHDGNAVMLVGIDRAAITNNDLRNNYRSISVNSTNSHVRFVGNDVRDCEVALSIFPASGTVSYDNIGHDWPE